jgi:hypothetical protein
VADPIRSSAVRVVRPYASEKEFVEGDFAWLSRPTLLLPSNVARPPGELVRFEFVLKTGTPVFRGEGQVLGHHPAGGNRPAGLEVRITRMDAKSKSILDQVRERRAVAARTAPKMVAPSIRPPTIAPPREPVSDPQSERSGIHLSPARARVTPPPNREEILGRLRERARQLAAKGALPLSKTIKSA